MVKDLEKRSLSDLLEKYSSRKTDIEKRLEDFAQIRNRSNRDIFAELVFCLLTPQSKAKQCWEAVLQLKNQNLLLSDDVDKISVILQPRVRFHKTKAKYIPQNRQSIGSNIKEKLAGFTTNKEMRAWLIENVKGFGWKEASHFLRNIGYYEDIAILDRHILLNLYRYGIIEEMPKSLTPRKYLEIEEIMEKFCEKKGIPMEHLDLLFWSEETGEIFK